MPSVRTVRWFWAVPGLSLAFAVAPRAPQAEPLTQPSLRRCPAEMVEVRDFCVDRFEMSTVDHRTGAALSPYYPPLPKLVESVFQSWVVERRNVGEASARELPLPELPEVQRGGRWSARAATQRGVVPQAYLSFPLARAACERAGKRLCSQSEWVSACKGEVARKFPYGEHFEPERCNVYRQLHPAQLLHGAAWYGHRDPRLNLVTEEDGTPLLRLTGSLESCGSRWGHDRVYDMVGNLDEWIDDESGTFVGGFYARSTREGCEASVSSHAPAYYDYSTGARCCKSQTLAD